MSALLSLFALRIISPSMHLCEAHLRSKEYSRSNVAFLNAKIIQNCFRELAGKIPSAVLAQINEQDTPIQTELEETEEMLKNQV